MFDVIKRIELFVLSYALSCALSISKGISKDNDSVPNEQILTKKHIRSSCVSVEILMKTGVLLEEQRIEGCSGAND